ncbi:MAG: hypothetical protein R3C49_20380 [Planctomycetaceae bacterium]
MESTSQVTAISGETYFTAAGEQLYVHDAYLAEVDAPTQLESTGHAERPGEWIANWSWGYDVSDNGEVVGTTDGAGVAFYWSEETGLVELTTDVGASAYAISNTGISVGFEFTSLHDHVATRWVDGTSARLDTPAGHNSTATAISPNGRYIGGETTFEELTYFTTFAQTVVWDDGNRIDLSDVDGEPVGGRVTAITDDGHTLVTSEDVHLWHPSFGAARELNEFLETDHGLTFASPLTWAYDMVHDTNRNELVILAGSHSHEDCTFNADIPGQPLCVTRTGQAQLITVSLDDVSDGVEAAPVVRWESSEAASYEFWINDAEANELVARHSGLTQASVVMNDLPDGKYLYWIQDEDSSGHGPWREKQALTIMNGKIITAASPGQLSWDASTDAATYEIWISSTATNRCVDRLSGLTGTTYDLPELDDGEYHYWVQHEDANGDGQWTARQSFWIADGQLSTTEPSVGMLEWDFDSNAETSEVWMNDGVSNSVVLRQDGLFSNQFNVPFLTDGSYYYWIQSEQADGSGVWGPKKTFEVVNGTIVDRTPVGTLFWPYDNTATSYRSQ